MSMTFNGTSEQLSNALNHMAENRPITKAEKAIAAEAAQYIKDTSVKLVAAEELADAANAVANWTVDGMLIDDPIVAEKYPLLSAELRKVRNTLAAFRAATGAA